MLSENDVVILSAVRTPIGSLNGCLSSFLASELATFCIKEALKRANLRGEEISEVILGQVLTAGQGQNPARQASLSSGIPYSVPCALVNQLCASGLRSVVMGYQSIKLGDAKVVVTGGMENMSKAPHFLHMRKGVKFGEVPFRDSMMTDGLIDAMHSVHMGITAENISKKYGVTRKEQDNFALNSQMKTKYSQDNNLFNNEIIPVIVQNKTGNLELKIDEFPRGNSTIEGLSKLKPSFLSDQSATVTAGNSSGVNDGAAILILSSVKEAKRIFQQQSMETSDKVISTLSFPLATIRGWHHVGVDPLYMGMGPVEAIRSATKKAGWSLDEVDLFEINEAFASQSLAVIRELKVDPNKVNKKGGAIALGHPIGASGARILVTLVHSLKEAGLKKGVAGLCVGGGQGLAVAVEMINSF